MDRDRAAVRVDTRVLPVGDDAVTEPEVIGNHIKMPDNTMWPRPEIHGDRMETSVQWKLRYAPDTLTPEDMLFAAAVMHAYNHLVLVASGRRIAEVKRDIKGAMGG